MIGFYLAAAAAILLAGVALGGCIAVCMAIRLEDRHYSMGRNVGSRMARGARRLTGLHTRGYC